VTPLAPLCPPSRAAGRARYAALALSLAIHGAAAALLFGAHDTRPVPGGAISVELVAAVPGGSAGAHETADRPAREPEPEKAVEPQKPAETTEVKPRPEPEEKPEPPVAPVAEEGRELAKPKPEPEAVRTLEETARPKLALKPAKAAAAAHKAEPDTARDTGSAGPAGSAANGPQVATVERTAPGFAVGSGANPLPDYPYHARRAGYQGRVVLRVAVGLDGTPRTVAVARSSGHDVLDDAALAAVRRWRFTPATVAGLPVEGTVEVPIEFRLVGDGR
jgi:protein TonB